MELGDIRGTPTEEIEEHNQQDNIISENIEVESIQTISEDICINENANISNQSSTVTIDQPIQNQPEIPNIERVRQSGIISGDTETNKQNHLSEQADFRWNEINGNVFCQRVTNAYEDIVHWKRNNFLVPSGKVGKSFIRELARLYQSYADDAPLE